MASHKEYVAFILEQFGEAEEVTARPMMGAYVIYCQGKVIGGVYDDRLLVKPTANAVKLMPEAPRVIPYDGAKEMLWVEELDDRNFLKTLAEAMYEELPFPKKKKKR